jgi:hypothetical protein
MGAQISRCVRFSTLGQVALTSLTNSLTTTPEIPMQEFAGGSIAIPSGSPITTLTFYGAIRPSSDPDPTILSGNTLAPVFYPMHTNDSLDTAITLTVSAGNIYALPANIFALGAIKITVNSAGQVELCFKG